MKKNFDLNDEKIMDILNDDTAEMLDELRLLLDEELAKPEDERDYDTVAELTSAIAEICGSDTDDEHIAEAADNIISELHTDRRRGITRTIAKWVSVLSACIVFGIALNLYTLASFGTDLFTTVVRITENGFSLDLANMPDTPVIATTGITTATNTDSYPATTTAATTTTLAYTVTGTGNTTIATSTIYDTTTAAYTTSVEYPTMVIPADNIMSQVISLGCSNEGVAPLVPSADPFSSAPLLKDNYSEKLEESHDFYFSFESEEQKISIILEKYPDKDSIPGILIPSDDTEYETVEAPYFTAFVFGDDVHQTAVFTRDNIVYTVSGYYFDRSEFTNFVMSFVPSAQK